ncbi:PepSY domain-containing protein [Ramlibacter sp. PS3R-8]|uniref:PepSY domain-containing protein n=1 Tax=Ramlibacter sp. PS3R-8 TaxID=3133437 RepID=UPI0030AA1774
MPYAVRLLLCAALVAAFGPASAEASRDDAAAAALRVASGRVLAVDRAQSGDRPVWRVKVVTAAGEVRVIVIDFASGQPVPPR